MPSWNLLHHFALPNNQCLTFHLSTFPNGGWLHHHLVNLHWTPHQNDFWHAHSTSRIMLLHFVLIPGLGKSSMRQFEHVEFWVFPRLVHRVLSSCWHVQALFRMFEYKVKMNARGYAKCYFLPCGIICTSGLANGNLTRLRPLDGKGVQTLEATDEKSNVVKVSIKERGKSYGGWRCRWIRAGRHRGWLDWKMKVW